MMRVISRKGFVVRLKNNSTNVLYVADYSFARFLKYNLLLAIVVTVFFLSIDIQYLLLL